MKISTHFVREIFEDALQKFTQLEAQELLEGVNERANCGRMAIYIHESSKQRMLPDEYVVDVEYNRKQSGDIKTIMNGSGFIVRVNCDIILHSRGSILEQDNLLAIEMKKSDTGRKNKQSDRIRLQALTQASFDGIWSADGKTLPEHVCGYALGVFMEIDRFARQINVEYYIDGSMQEQKNYQF